METSQRHHARAFKAKVALEVARAKGTVTEISRERARLGRRNLDSVYADTVTERVRPAWRLRSAAAPTRRPYP